jgi:hypothetical protein
MTERGVIVLAGQPDWAATLARLAGQQGFDLVLAGEGDLIARLVDTRAALLIVDGARPDWRAVAVLPRTSPATRRISTLVISADPAVYAQADDLGLAAVLSLETLTAGLPGVLPSTLVAWTRHWPSGWPASARSGAAVRSPGGHPQIQCGGVLPPARHFRGAVDGRARPGAHSVPGHLQVGVA